MARKQVVASQSSGSAPKWSYRAEFIMACNCDWGCPCNFNAPPTYGTCEGGWAFMIKTGHCGEIKLDGLAFALMAKWPKAVHYGGGIAKIWIDEKASTGQRVALDKIVKGKYGGKPWPMFARTFESWLETSFVPFEWKLKGANSKYQAGDEVRVALEPIRNPVTGKEVSAKIVLPRSLVLPELNITSTKVFSVFSEGLKYANPGKNASFGTTKHGS